MSSSSYSQKRPLPTSFWVLLALFILLLIAGIGAIVFYFSSSATASSTDALWADPWNMPEPERISSGRAILALSGMPPNHVFGQAMAVNDLDTMAATALLSLNIPANQRLGWLNTLAHRFVLEKRRPGDAHVFLQYTADLAMTLPDLPDYLRADMLVQTSDGWRKLEDYETAQWALAQALEIARYSPELTPPLRKNLINDIANAYARIGNTAKSQEIRSSVLPEIEVLPPLSSTLESIQLSPLVYPNELTTLQQEREQAAQRFVDEWMQGGGNASPEAAQNLGSKLMAEDEARRAYYQNELDRSDATDDYKARVLFAQIDWLATKYRVSGRLYGVSLVPNWEQDRTNIGVALRNAILALHEAINTYVASLPTEQQPATRAAMNRLITSWSILGIYVGADKHAITDALNGSIADWGRGGVFPKAEVREDRIHIELFHK